MRTCVAICAMLLSSCAAPVPADEPRVPAMIDADCAPWDGAAFTLSIPIDTGRMMRISIYQAPEIQRGATFEFPDPSGRLGYAYYRPEFGPDETLTGRISFRSVEPGIPVEGDFDLQSESSFRYRAAFRATWGEDRASCG